jgi:hypothetical protein
MVKNQSQKEEIVVCVDRLETSGDVEINYLANKQVSVEWDKIKRPHP